MGGSGRKPVELGEMLFTGQDQLGRGQRIR